MRFNNLRSTDYWLLPFLKVEPDVQDIIQAIKKKYNFDTKDIFSQSRRDSVCKPRHLAWYLLYHFTDLSLIECAEVFNRTHHTTVLNSIEYINDVIKSVEVNKRRFNKTEYVKIKPILDNFQKYYDIKKPLK